MDRIALRGGARLEGRIAISGSKNAALPLMCAALLTEEPVTFTNAPLLADIRSLKTILDHLGAEVSLPEFDDPDRPLTVHAGRLAITEAPYDLVRKMRASFLVLGPILARRGEAKVSLPGGCAIGTRPVDLHLKALEAMGVEITLESGYVHAKAPKGLKGAQIHFPMVSVGATEHALMAAALADGVTVLDNAAREPEVSDLAHCLVAMGAQIAGIGTSRLEITGRQRLSGVRHRIISDRIETGTFACAAAITNGSVDLVNTNPEYISALIPVLQEAGVNIEVTADDVRIRPNGHRHGGLKIVTQPYPGFPTDMQAQVMAMLATADGTSEITENIFENRFMHVPELLRMGADITIHGRTATIRGVKRLVGAPVMATDLRASVSLVLAGLMAEGETIVNRIYHLDRGFERIEDKLRPCGAEIERLTD